MSKSSLNIRIGLAAILIILAALSRLLPHPPNFTALGGMAMFGAAYLNRKWLMFVIPFAALWFSDLIINNTIYASYYEGFVFFAPSSLFVYLGFGGMILLGIFLLKSKKPLNIFVTTIIATLLFFLVTNFGSWATYGTYPKTAAGLGAAYIAGLPYLLNSIAGNVFFVALLFGAFEWLNQRYPQLSVSHG